jgi:2,3-bisphosphoglycerate-independent phosphoglycerate mutase
MMKSRTGILIILDGFGLNPDPSFNAIAQAKAPHIRKMMKEYPHSQLEASESHVGLPKGFMGNSEVGHLNIGAGRVVFQDFSLISHAIEDGSFFTNPKFLKLLEKIKETPKAALHLMGLVSDGGVHSHLSHLFALLQLAKRQGIKQVYIHVFTDGRDTAPTSGRSFVETLENFLQDTGVGKIATVMGRFYAMDRDSRWDRTESAYKAIVSGVAENSFAQPTQYVRKLYDEGITDEFLVPGVREGYSGVKDEDGIIFFNFRADRARQLTRALIQDEFAHFQRAKLPDLCGFVCMTPYDESFRVEVAYGKPKVPNTLGEIISRQGWKQLRIAETEKYAHVTYFFNGGEERVFEGEKRVLIPSPREVRTYDLKPEMSAREVTARLLSELSEEEYKFVVVNFANPDMVGHTGVLTAAIKAIEVIDECLGKILDWIESNNAFAILTADHGNCEMMQSADGMPLTSHTLLPVPFVVIDPKNTERKLAPSGSLCDIAPSLLDLWGITPPAEMTGKSLLL